MTNSTALKSDLEIEPISQPLNPVPILEGVLTNLSETDLENLYLANTEPLDDARAVAWQVAMLTMGLKLALDKIAVLETSVQRLRVMVR